MTFTTFCILAFILIILAMERDPVVKFVIANPGYIIARIAFAHWYMLTTHPWIMIPHMRFFPVQSIIFYSILLEEYHEIFPEVNAEDEEDWDDVE